MRAAWGFLLSTRFPSEQTVVARALTFRALGQLLAKHERYGPHRSPLVRQERLNVKGYLEAAIGFEPMHRGFADLSLTTWVRRPAGSRQLENASSIMPVRVLQLKRNVGLCQVGFSAGCGPRQVKRAVCHGLLLSERSVLNAPHRPSGARGQ